MQACSHGCLNWFHAVAEVELLLSNLSKDVVCTMQVKKQLLNHYCLH